MNEVPLEQLSWERFAELIGSAFTVATEGGSRVVLKLTTVTQPRFTGAGASGAQYENFSLFLDGPPDRPLPQQIYTIEHSQLGHFSVFMVPISNERSCFQYQVIFNRLRQNP